jgi:hypothetical protein
MNRPASIDAFRGDRGMHQQQPQLRKEKKTMRIRRVGDDCDKLRKKEKKERETTAIRIGDGPPATLLGRLDQRSTRIGAIKIWGRRRGGSWPHDFIKWTGPRPRSRGGKLVANTLGARVVAGSAPRRGRLVVGLWLAWLASYLSPDGMRPMETFWST